MQDRSSFWAQKGQMNDEEPASSFEANTLRALIEHRTTPAETVGPLISTREDEGPLDGKMNRVGWLILDAAMAFPAEQERLMDLVLAIDEFPVAQMGWTEEQKRRFPNWEKSISSDQIGVLFVDWRNTAWAARFEPDEDDGETLEDSIRTYRSINAWFARLYLRTNNLYDLAYGLVRVREALEKDLQAGAEGADKAYDVETPAAAVYFILLAKQIFAFVDRPVGELSRSLDKKGDLWTGETGLPRARWDFWKQRLRTIAAREGLRDATKSDITEALEAMERAESSW